MAPTSIIGRIKALYAHEEIVPPPFGTTVATFILVAYTIVYVAPFYLTSTTRPSPSLSRDAPSVIRGRIRLVTISCTICSLTTFFTILVHNPGRDGVFLALHNMGYYPIGLSETVSSLSLLFLLFLGPLFEAAIVEGAWRDWIRLHGFTELFGSWMGYRNIVAGPLTEEILFRSAAVPLFLLSQASIKTMVFATPLIFGLAHIHHFYEFRITHPHTSVATAVARSCFQLTYTFLFGSYCTFVYLRTGSLLAVVLAHAFCNWMGLPRFWGRVGGDGETLIGPDVGADGRRNWVGEAPARSHRINTLWTLAYYVLLVVGAVLFSKNLWGMTESEAELVGFANDL